MIALSRALGCGMEMTGELMALPRQTMLGTIRSPNVASAVLIGLDCESNQIPGLVERRRLSAEPM